MLGGVLIGGVFAYEGIPVIKERLCSGNDAHSPIKAPRNSKSEIAMVEKGLMLDKRDNDRERTIPPEPSCFLSSNRVRRS